MVDPADFNKSDKDVKARKDQLRGDKVAPGKASATDNYGQGGAGVQTPGIPGKTNNTDQLPVGANGDHQPAQALGKTPNANANGAPNANSNANANANANGKDGASKAGKSGGGGGAASTQADHAASGDTATTSSNAKAGGNANANSNGKGSTIAKLVQSAGVGVKQSAVPIGAVKQAAPVANDKVVAPADRVVVGDRPQLPSVTLEPPRQNKNLADKWLKETGRTPQEHFVEINQQVEAFRADAKRLQDELLKAGDDHATQLSQEISNQVTAFSSTTVAQGRERVRRAYAKLLEEGLDAAATDALLKITASKQQGDKQIAQSSAAAATQFKTKFTAAKAEVNNVIKKNTAPAANALRAFAQRIPAWVADGKQRAHTGAKQAADSFPLPASDASSPAKAEAGLIADVKRSHATKHGQKLGTQYELSLSGMAKEIPKRADEVTRLALQDSTIEFEEALKAADDGSSASLKKTTADATAALTAQEETARTAVTDAKTNGTKRFQSEQTAALELADKAGKDFADNTTAATTELTDRLKNKANEDAKSYAVIVGNVLNPLKKGGPHKAEDVKTRLAGAREQLAQAHAKNLEELQKAAASGKTDLQAALQGHQQTYAKAVADRETAAQQVKAEVLDSIGKGAAGMSGSLASIGTQFTKLANDESEHIEFARKEFLANADLATSNFENLIKQHLEQQQAKLELNLNGNVAVAKIKEDIEDPSNGEAVKKKSDLGKDAAGLRDAFDGAGTNESKIFSILRKCGPGEVTYLEAVYDQHYHWRAQDGMTPLRYDIDDEMSGNEKAIALAYLNHNRAEAIKLELADSTGFWNDDEARIEEVLRGCSDDEIKFLNDNPEAQRVVANVKDSLGGADLDVMTTLLDKSVDAETRQSKATAVRLFDAMDGVATDEAKMKEIFEAAATDEERFRLRQQFNQYATARGESGGDGGEKGEADDALARMIDGEFSDRWSGGEQAMMLEYAKVDREHSDLKIAKMYDAADGGGTNEQQLFDALDDEEYARQWEAAKDDPERQKALEVQHKAILDKKLDKMTGGSSETAQGLIDDEMDHDGAVTYGEFIAGKRENGTPLTAAEIANVKSEGPAVNHLEWMVAQRKLQTGRAEPELLLAYACWGVVGTDEEMIKKVLSDNGEPKSRAALHKIRADFYTRWNKMLWTGDELNPINWDFPAPGGVLSDELSGKDWNDIRVLLCGKPETAEHLNYVTKLRLKRATSGLLGGTLMTIGEAVGLTEAKSTMEHTEADFNRLYAEKYANNPKAALGSADTAELEHLAEYLQQDIEAYTTTLNAIVDSCVQAIEIIGGVVITVVTAGTASPVLAAILANLALSAGTMVFKKLTIGDDYGGAEAMGDAIAAAGNAAFAGAGEWKALTNLSDKIAKPLTTKALSLIEKGAQKGGFRIAGKALTFSEKSIEAITKRVSSGTKNVIIGTGQQIYNTLTNEKTYDKKVGEALWGEGSLGAAILKGAPQQFAQGYVTQWVNEGAGTSNKDNAGRMPGPVRNALFNGLAEMAGTTAGFFVYLDNWKDGELAWTELLKANAKAGLTGSFQGYALHKTRAKRSGREYISGELKGEQLDELIRSMDDREKSDFVAFIEKYDHENKAPPLPESLKAYSKRQPPAPPALPPANDNNANTTNGNNTNNANVDNNNANNNNDANDNSAGGGSGGETKPEEKDVKKQPSANDESEADKKRRDDETRRQREIDEENARIAAEKAQEAAKHTARNEAKDDAGETTSVEDQHEKKKTAATEVDPQKKQQEDEAWRLRHEEEQRRQKEIDDELQRELAMHDADELRKQWGEDEEIESESETQSDRDTKRRDKRRRKDASEEKEQDEREATEDAREEHQEGDAKRKQTKEERAQKKRDERRLDELVDLATLAHAEYAPKIEEAKDLLRKIAGDLGEVQGRPKDPESAANRLQRAEKRFGAQITDVQSAKDNIWDALGTRVVVTGNPDEIRKVLKNLGLAAKSGAIEIVKAASNHGDGVAPYLTQADLDILGSATNGKADTENGVKTAKADQSAFTSGLIFVKYPDGTRGEIQIIGKQVLEIAAIEHIPYDLSIGKPLARGMDEANLEQVRGVTAPVEAAMKALEKTPAKKAEYEQYLRDLYKHARDAELGIDAPPPKLPSGIDEVLSADGLKSVYEQIETIKKKAKSEQQTGDAPSPVTGKAAAKDIDPKTRSEDGHQTEKPEFETAEDAKARRSQPLKPSAPWGSADTWAEPSNRLDVPDTVPLTRQELRDLITERYSKTLEPFIKNASNPHLPSNENEAVRQQLRDLQDDIRTAIKNGGGKISPDQSQEFLGRWTKITSESTGHKEESKLRILYELVERDDFPVWYDHIRHLPKEQQAKLGHMWREEWKIFVRDMMSDPDSKEVLYLRDLGLSGDRRGKRFDEFITDNMKKGLTEDQAMDAVIQSTMTSNAGVNKALGGSQDEKQIAINEILTDRAQNNDDRRRHLDDLAKQLQSDDVETKTKAAAEIEAIKNNPDWKEIVDKHRLINDLFATFKQNDPTAKKYQRNEEDIALMSDHIGELLAHQDKARQGKDPVMQAKRERFERSVALAVLDPKGPVAEKINGELDRLCTKAVDYIERMKSKREQRAAVESLGTAASKGYGGGVGNEYEMVMKVLQGGNIRERMLALANFGEMMMKDGLSTEGRAKLEHRAEHGSTQDTTFSAEDAQRILDRLRLYEQNSNGQRNAKDALKPIGDEKSTVHKDYADAKAQNMDTKMPELLAEKVNAFLGTQAANGEYAKGAESSPLARTTITVKEALHMGLQLSEREIAAAGGLDAPLNWVVGQRANMVDPKAKFIADAKSASMPLKAGISGTTFRWMLIVDLLGGNPETARLAAVASLQAADAHSWHEIATAAKGFGAPYDSSKPYDNMGLDRAFLEDLAKSQGTSLEDLQDFRDPAEKKKKKKPAS